MESKVLFFQVIDQLVRGQEKEAQEELRPF